MSESPSLERFEPHVAATAADSEPLVWAVDTRHLPLYWFPPDRPRGTFWAHAGSDLEDVRRLLGGASRVHAVEAAWLDRVRTARLFAYRFPEEPFEPHPEVGGYWIAHEPVRATDVAELWREVAASTLEFSGIRLRNAEPMLEP